MNKLTWTTSKYVPIDRYLIPCSDNLNAQINQDVGVHNDTKTWRTIKRMLYPLLELKDDLLIDGFIERDISRWIKDSLQSDTVFLEIGCGDMHLRKALPASICYNAFDVLISEIHLSRAIKDGAKINIAIASATDIPLEDNCASLLVSTETFEHIPEIDQAVEEIYRVAKPGARLLVSIPNNYCYKYTIKGPHSGHINNWTFQDFQDFMKAHNFITLKSYMKGYWIPYFIGFQIATKDSYQLSIISNDEYYNTNFFYMFEAKK